MGKKITLSKTYRFPVSKVWAALTDAEALSEWLMPCNFKPEIGCEFEFNTKPYPGFDGITHCKVLALEPESLLSFSWRGGSLKSSVVTFKLTPIDEQSTRLDFEHSGFDGLFNRLIVRNILSNGWKNKILTVNLPQYLSK